MRGRCRSTPAAIALNGLAKYRSRLAGIYDVLSGDPLADVEVMDLSSGTSSKTTATGTVALYFLPEGTTTVRLRRDGFRDSTLAVTISPTDTVPLTVVLSRRSP